MLAAKWSAQGHQFLWHSALLPNPRRFYGTVQHVQKDVNSEFGYAGGDQYFNQIGYSEKRIFTPFNARCQTRNPSNQAL